MFRKAVLVVVFTSILIALLVAKYQGSSWSHKRDIEQRIFLQTFISAIAEGDVRKIIPFYSDDATVVKLIRHRDKTVESMETLKTKEDLENFWNNFHEIYKTKKIDLDFRRAQIGPMVRISPEIYYRSVEIHQKECGPEAGPLVTLGAKFKKGEILHHTVVEPAGCWQRTVPIGLDL